jgi:Zn-dependent alcohol dehydrogenase
MAGPVGGFAEYTTVSEYQIVKIPEDMPIDRAALLSCAVMTGFGVVVNRAKVKPLESVVVVGTGGVGLNAIQGAAYSGAHPVIAVDILDNKLEAARTFGATHTINSTKEKDPVKTVKELTSGRGADYIFITVGSAEALRLGFSMSGKRGLTVIVGIAGGNLPIAGMELVNGERMLAGCMLGSARLAVDIPALVALYQVGRLKLDELVTGRYPLDRINEAIESMEKGEALRNVIIF